jgi:superfamily II DNA or RNA helicase
MGMRTSGKKMPLPPQYLYSCFEIPAPHPWAGGLAAPRHLALGDVHPGLNVQHKYTQPKACKINLAPDFTPRAFQAKAPGLLATYASGYVVAPTGAGKTSLGLGCAAHLDTKCLVIVHTKDLAQQWIARAAKQLVHEDGSPVIATLCGDGEWNDSGRIVVAILQSLASMPFEELYAFGQKFGLVIADEWHHLVATTYSYVMCCMPARYRLGISATPYRHDGLNDLLFYHMPLKLLEVELSDLARMGLVLLPKVEYLYTNWSSESDSGEWTDLVTEMTLDAGRNAKIVRKAKELVDTGRQVLILSERVAHCEALAKACEELVGVPSAALVGKLPKKKRQQLLADADSGALRIITATQLADEGLDLPGLGAVVLTVPTKAIGRITQRVGRIMRSQTGKQEPIVVDCVDDHDAFRGMRRGRERLYKKLGCRLA